MTRRFPGTPLLLALSILAGAGRAPAATPPSGSTVAAAPRTGDVHDFDYFAGGWETHQHRLKARGVGSKEWEDFPGTLCMTPYLGGMATVDEIYFPTKGWAGLTLRTFDLEKRQWLIYWVSSATGKLDPPVVGGFDGDHGEFYGDDRDNGRPVKVRFLWKKLDHDHARWEQTFFYDNGTAETNWTADFVRADPAKVCENGRPKRTRTAEEELRRAIERYADLVLAMDNAGIAALFTADGEAVADGQAPLHGPAAIRAHLETFKEYHVLAETLTPDEIAVSGDTGHVAGKYHQRVRIPSGEVVEVGGTYTADWVRDNAGAWHIRRMATVSQR